MLISKLVITNEVSPRIGAEVVTLSDAFSVLENFEEWPTTIIFDTNDELKDIVEYIISKCVEEGTSIPFQWESSNEELNRAFINYITCCIK